MEKYMFNGIHESTEKIKDAQNRMEEAVRLYQKRLCKADGVSIMMDLTEAEATFWQAAGAMQAALDQLKHVTQLVEKEALKKR